VDFMKITYLVIVFYYPGSVLFFFIVLDLCMDSRGIDLLDSIISWIATPLLFCWLRHFEEISKIFLLLLGGS